MFDLPTTHFAGDMAKNVMELDEDEFEEAFKVPLDFV